MALQLLVGGLSGEGWAALCEGPRLVEIVIERPERPSHAGDVHLGRLIEADRGLGAAFVEIGLGRPGLLPLRELKPVPSAGAAILVQVVRDPRGDKGARLTARLAADREALERAAATARAPARLHRADPLLRLIGENAGAIEDIACDGRRRAAALAEALAKRLPDLAGRVRFRPRRDWVPSAPELVEQIEAALEPGAPLPSGGSLLFEPGETLTAVDVDSGGTAGGTGERALLRADLEAAAAIPRQLRLRNIGGIVVVDFIDLRRLEDRRRVAEALRAGLAADPAAGWSGPMSRLGLVELTRRRRGPSLSEMLAIDCPSCGGRGRAERADWRSWFAEG